MVDEERKAFQLTGARGVVDRVRPRLVFDVHVNILLEGPTNVVEVKEEVGLHFVDHPICGKLAEIEVHFSLTQLLVCVW